jgi:hypothetical protein
MHSSVVSLVAIARTSRWNVSRDRGVQFSVNLLESRRAG